MEKPRYRQFEHTADWGAECYGESLAEAFCNAARAMFDGFVRVALVPPASAWSFECDGGDYEELLVRFLGTLLTRHDTEHALFLDFRLKELTPTHLEAEIDVAPAGHPAEYFGAAVKAVTFHNLEVKETPNSAVVRVIFDV